MRKKRRGAHAHSTQTGSYFILTLHSKKERQGRMIGLTAKGSVSPTQTNTPPTLFLFLFCILLLDLYARHTQTTRRVSRLRNFFFHGATQYVSPRTLFFKCAGPYKAETFPLVFILHSSSFCVCEKHETTTS